MSRIALLGDVHGNLPALEAVLEHARRQGAEAVWNAGDWVVYGPFPNEVIARLREAEAIGVLGNLDLKVLRFPKRDEKWRLSKRPEKWLALKLAWRQLSRKSREFLLSLPREVRLEVGGRTALLTHGSPESIDEHLYSDTPPARLRELAELARAEIVVCGHSHEPFATEVERAWFINTGSVGRPDDGDPRACYAILDVAGDRLRVRHHRIRYDVDVVLAALDERGFPPVFAEMFRLGRSLKWVLEQEEAVAGR